MDHRIIGYSILILGVATISTLLFYIVREARLERNQSFLDALVSVFLFIFAVIGCALLFIWEIFFGGSFSQSSARKGRLTPDIEPDEKKRRQIERGKVTPSIRYDVMRRDNFRCRLCGRSAANGIELEVDHIIPISRGGTSDKDNLQTLCRDCNRGKGAKQ